MLFAFDVRAMDLGYGQHISTQRSQEFEAYANWILLQFKQFMGDSLGRDHGLRQHDTPVSHTQTFIAGAKRGGGGTGIGTTDPIASMTKVDCLAKVASSRSLL